MQIWNNAIFADLGIITKFSIFQGKFAKIAFVVFLTEKYITIVNNFFKKVASHCTYYISKNKNLVSPGSYVVTTQVRKCVQLSDTAYLPE